MTMPRLLAAIAALALLLPSNADAQWMPVELREGELALAVGLPLEIEVGYAFRALPIPLTLGASALPLAEGGSLSISVRPVLARFADHRLVLATSIGALALGLDGLSSGGRGDLSLQLIFTAARLSDVALVVALVPGLDVAVWAANRKAGDSAPARPLRSVSRGARARCGPKATRGPSSTASAPRRCAAAGAWWPVSGIELAGLTLSRLGLFRGAAG
jgi:hypothetical protein